MKRIICAVVCVILVVAMFTSCDTGNTIKIGVFEPLTGNDAKGGQLELEGIKLAHEKVGTVLNKKVQLVIQDNKSLKTTAVNVIKDLADKKNVIAMIGSWGTQYSNAASIQIMSKGVPSIAPSCTGSDVTRNNEYYFRACFIDEYEGTLMANYAFKMLTGKDDFTSAEKADDKVKKPTVALLICRPATSTYSYSQNTAEAFKQVMIKKVGDREKTIKAIEYYAKDTMDFTTALNNIKATNPDVIYAPGDSKQVAAIAKKAKELGIKSKILTGDTVENQEFLDDGGADVEGVTIISFFDINHKFTEETTKFLDAYKKSGDKSSQELAVIAQAYDAYMIMIDAIERAGSTDATEIRQALYDTKDFQGATGVINFDKYGDAQKDGIVKVVENGQFKMLQTISNK